MTKPCDEKAPQGIAHSVHAVFIMQLSGDLVRSDEIGRFETCPTTFHHVEERVSAHDIYVSASA